MNITDGAPNAQDEADLIRCRIITVAAQLIAIANIAEADAQAGQMDAQALANTFAWAIDAGRNALPAEPLVAGMGMPDRYGKPIVRAVALSEDEIEWLYHDHVHGAKAMRPRKGKPHAPDFSAWFAWHSARVPFFKAMLPVEEPDDIEQDEVEQAAAEMRDPSDIRCGAEVINGHVVDMQEPSA